MWQSSPLTSAVQLEALRVVSDWWETSRARWPLSGFRRTAVAPGGPAADVLVPPPGYTPVHLDERLAGAS